MKNKWIIFILLLVFVTLMGRLFLEKKEEKQGNVPKIEFNNAEELELFVTLENEIACCNLGIVQSTSKDINREPDYVSLYPNLYADPKTEWEEHIEGQKICYLTFDDGPSQNTLSVLDTLDEKQIKATFFVIGEEIALSEENKEILKEIVKRGHLIGLHTYCHDYRTIYSSVDAFLSDYEKVFNMIEEITGQRPYIYRFPGGSSNCFVRRFKKELMTEMERRGFIFYDWNVSGEDAVGAPTTYSIKKNINKDLTKYSFPVVLLHDGYSNQLTAKILPSILDAIKEKGYEFGTLDDRRPCQFKW